MRHQSVEGVWFQPRFLWRSAVARTLSQTKVEFRVLLAAFDAAHQYLLYLFILVALIFIFYRVVLVSPAGLASSSLHDPYGTVSENTPNYVNNQF